MKETKAKKTRISPAATFVVCPMCDEKKCFGKENCPQIAGYLKRKEQEMCRRAGHVR